MLCVYAARGRFFDNSGHASGYASWHCGQSIGEAMPALAWTHWISITVSFWWYWHCFRALIRRGRVRATLWRHSWTYVRLRGGWVDESIGWLDWFGTAVRWQFFINEVTVRATLILNFPSAFKGAEFRWDCTTSKFLPSERVVLSSSMFVVSLGDSI